MQKHYTVPRMSVRLMSVVQDTRTRGNGLKQERQATSRENVFQHEDSQTLGAVSQGVSTSSIPESDQDVFG